MTTLFLKHFTVLDFAYACPQHGPRGESWNVSAELSGSLDEKGFIFDFGPAKKTLKQAIDDSFDHKFIVPASLWDFSQNQLHIKSEQGVFTYQAPAEALVKVLEFISPESLASVMEKAILPLLPNNITGLKLLLEPSHLFDSEANFRYTHGLRLHNGNCQRLIHGHRNPIEVYINQKRIRQWENWLANLWEDIHFAHAETVVNRQQLDLPLYTRQNTQHSQAQAHIEYSAPQGLFIEKLPANRVFLLETEPSIENIARVGAELIRKQGQEGLIKVVAYEGLNKGASYQLN